jgi:hypothetical protein
MEHAPDFRLSHERAGRMLAGLSVLATLALGCSVSPWFLLATAGVALNLVISAITDRCVVKSLLVRMGLPGERDLGRAEALREMPQPAGGGEAIPVPVDPTACGRRFARHPDVALESEGGSGVSREGGSNASAARHWARPSL